MSNALTYGIAVLGAVACLGMACHEPAVSSEQLANSAESHLRYPHATYVGPRTGKTGVLSSSSFAEYFLGTNDQPDDLANWYNAQLLSQRWTSVPSSRPSWAWKNTDVSAVLDCADPIRTSPFAASLATFGHVCEFTLVSGPAPRPTASPSAGGAP